MPDMNPENNRDTFQGRGVQIQQYKEALEKTKKNMMEMERDLYLKINELEKENEELKEFLFLLKEYVFCDENILTEDAKALRTELLERIKETK